MRGTALMALSNQYGHLILTTGNKSELATGFSTLYGDSAGGYAPIKDVPKTLVWQLSRWRNAVALRRPASLEPIPGADHREAAVRRAGARTSSTATGCPTTTELDEVLDGYVERDLGHDELIAAGFDVALVERVIRLVDLAEYKRRQYPPGPKVTGKAFGRDRRLPITSAWREPSAGS